MSCSVRRVVAASCVAALLVGTLAGCGSKEESSKPASQVAVKVNKEEITVHQIDTQFDTLVASRGGNIPSDQIDRARSAVVERLIDQELFLQKAKENKLDRNPKVQQMIDLSRREILARAYSEQVMNGAPRPTDQQIKDYFDKNPALFAERRVYTLQEINIQVPPERFDEVHARVQAGGNIQALKDWLKEQKMPFVENSGTKPAEQLPFEILGSLAKASPGQATFIRIPSGALLLWVVGIQDAPITLNNARRVIENYLINQARSEAMRNELKRLRETAVIEYEGNFAPPPESSAAVPQQNIPSAVDSAQTDPAGNDPAKAADRGDIKFK